MFASALVAGLCTPSGFRLYAHTLGYLGDSYMVDNTAEYTSPNFHVLHFAVIAIVLVFWVLATLPRRPRYPTLTIVAVNLAFALIAVRNLPLFGIVVLPLVAAEGQRSLAGRIPHWATRWSKPASPRATRLSLAWPAVALVAMFVLARSPRYARADTADATTYARTLLPSTFNPSKFPVRAVRAARAARLQGRLLSEFIWGGYILYAWPEQRVFIDGQTDFYGDSIMREHSEIMGLQPGWRAKLAAWKIDLALIQTNSGLSDALAHEPGWKAVYCDSTAILFQRDSSRGPALAPMKQLSNRCASMPVEPLRAP
jgi:hypothetical protein